jgi:RNA polymerase sigma-70 factor, ECF subfamily
MLEAMARRDTELLKLARTGDREAFDVLARRYSGRILATSRRILRNPADAEDNLQNVLFKAFTNLWQFRESALLSTWLTRITINEALMKLRSSAAEKNHLYSAESEPPRAEGSPRRCSPESQCIARQLAFRAVKAVPRSLRDAFVLFAVEGWTHKELSATQGVALQTVKTRIFRARRRMKEELRNEA